MRKFELILVLCCASAVHSIRYPKEYTINLDLAPEERFAGLIPAFPEFNKTVWSFYDSIPGVVRDALYLMTIKRGKEPSEMQAEIEGLAAISKLPVRFVQGIQMLYEIQTTMVPIVNFSKKEEHYYPEGMEALQNITWRGPGCTGIIAKTADGTVTHARNLDFSPVNVMTNLVYTGIFTKGGKEIFRSQMIAGYQQVITGMRMGPNGYAIERNTRYPDHKKGDEEMFTNILNGRTLNGWHLRKTLENIDNYDDAIMAIANAPFASSEYSIVSGVKKGTIISKNAEAAGVPPVAYRQVLGQPNFGERDDYIIITNFDFFWHDIREYFDPTGGTIGKPRRIQAQKLLDSTPMGQLTAEFLYDTINAKGVLADTVFQAIMNVENGLWNVSMPDL